MAEKKRELLVSSNIIIDEPNFVKEKGSKVGVTINEEGIKLDGFS